MDGNYCVLCQDAHKMTESCLQDVQCKLCHRKGHLRIDCPDQLQVRQEGQEERGDDKCEGDDGGGREVLRGRKRKNALSDSDELPPAKATRSMIKKANNSDSVLQFKVVVKNTTISDCSDDCNIFDLDDLASRRTSLRPVNVILKKNGVKVDNRYVAEDDTENIVEMVAGDNEAVKEIEGQNVEESNDCSENGVYEHEHDHDRANKSVDTCIVSSDEESDKENADIKVNLDNDKGNVIIISDDEEVSQGTEELPVSVVVQGSLVVFVDKTPELARNNCLPSKVQQTTNGNSNTDKSLEENSVKSKVRKSPMLNAGNYPVISTHIELFRSSKSPSNKLTQVRCLVSGSESGSGSFFRAIKPRGLEKYLDNYKLGGDLMKALHMTREEDGKFLYRSQFEIVEDEEKIFCSEEHEALEELLGFLQDYPGCIILGIDEDSVSILVKKLKEVNKDKFKELVIGFTYWKRVLKYLDVPGYKNTDLEEYFSQNVAEDLSSFTIPEVLLKAVLEVSTNLVLSTKVKRHFSVDDFYKLCKRIDCLEKPNKVEYNRKAEVENVEVFSSFRPFVSATFSAEKLEQVIVSSESDSEPEETGRSVGNDHGAMSNEQEARKILSAIDRETNLFTIPVILKKKSNPPEPVVEIPLLTQDKDASYAATTKELKCPICTQHFEEMSKVMVHLKANHAGNEETAKRYDFWCGLCRKGFETERQYEDHEKIPHKYGCKHCHKAYILEVDLHHHVENHHVEISVKDADIVIDLVTHTQAESALENSREPLFTFDRDTDPMILTNKPILKKKTNLPRPKSQAKPKPQPLKEMATKSKYWQKAKHPLKDHPLNRMTDMVTCPIMKCISPVKFKNVGTHVTSVHKAKLTSLLCENCKSPVVPSDLAGHMSTCQKKGLDDCPQNTFSSTPGASSTGPPPLVPPSIGLLPLGPQISEPPPLGNKPPRPLVTYDLDVWDCPPQSPRPVQYPGLSFATENDEKCLASLRIYLDRKVVSKGAIIITSCKMVYLDYHKFVKNRGEVKILPPTKFMQEVKKIVLSKWKMDVGPWKSGRIVPLFENMSLDGLFFKGLKIG